MPLSLSNMTPNWKPTMMLHWLSMDRAAQLSSWQLKIRSKDLGMFLLRDQERSSNWKEKNSFPKNPKKQNHSFHFRQVDLE